MKTKAFIIRTLVVLLAVTAVVSCSKSSDPTKTPTKTNTPTKLSPLNGTWSITAYGGVQNNGFAYNVDTTTAIAKVTYVGNQAFGFTVGENFLINIKYVSTDNFSATITYTYGTNNATTSTRPCIITLQNNETQMTLDCPAINVNFPEIIYIYQKGALAA